MSSDNEVSIEVETIEKIIKELNEISLLCSEPHLKVKIEALQSYISSVTELNNKVSAEDVIYEKMVEVKYSNPELHLKLYMLYRNLMSGRISELDAMSSFESCLSLYPSDIMVF
jgi:hypothetical protein